MFCILLSSLNSFIAIGDDKRLLQPAHIQMRRLIKGRLIRIYAGWHSVFQFYILAYF